MYLLKKKLLLKFFLDQLLPQLKFLFMELHKDTKLETTEPEHNRTWLKHVNQQASHHECVSPPLSPLSPSAPSENPVLSFGFR